MSEFDVHLRGKKLLIANTPSCCPLFFVEGRGAVSGDVRGDGIARIPRCQSPPINSRRALSLLLPLPMPCETPGSAGLARLLVVIAPTLPPSGATGIALHRASFLTLECLIRELPGAIGLGDNARPTELSVVRRCAPRSRRCAFYPPGGPYRSTTPPR